MAEERIELAQNAADIFRGARDAANTVGGVLNSVGSAVNDATKTAKKITDADKARNVKASISNGATAIKLDVQGDAESDIAKSEALFAKLGFKGFDGGKPNGFLHRDEAQKFVAHYEKLVDNDPAFKGLAKDAVFIGPQLGMIDLAKAIATGQVSPDAPLVLVIAPDVMTAMETKAKEVAPKSQGLESDVLAAAAGAKLAYADVTENIAHNAPGGKRGQGPVVS